MPDRQNIVTVTFGFRVDGGAPDASPRRGLPPAHALSLSLYHSVRMPPAEDAGGSAASGTAEAGGAGRDA